MTIYSTRSEWEAAQVVNGPPSWDWTWDVTDAAAEASHDYISVATNTIQGVSTKLKRTATAAHLDGSTGFVLNPPASLHYSANNTPWLVAKIDDCIGGDWDPAVDIVSFQWRMSGTTDGDFEAIGGVLLESEGATDGDVVGMWRTYHSSFSGPYVRFNEGVTQLAASDSNVYDFGEIVMFPYGFTLFRLGVWTTLGSTWPDPMSWTAGITRVRNGSNQSTGNLTAPPLSQQYTAANAHWGIGAYDSSNLGVVGTFPGWRAGRLAVT